MSDMRLVHLVGATGRPRVEMHDGREHLVVPVVALIGDNVIHAVNAPTAEFVPTACLSASGWDGRPLVLGHPTRDGRQVSANDPKVLEERGFGFMANTRLTNRRLATEAWCDVAKLKRLGAERMLEDLREGRHVEVSVGAFVQTRNRRGEHNGRRYHAEWATTASDHLAFLPGGRGACSGEMGCGANRAAMRVAEGSDEMEEVRALDNPEGINQYSKGGGGHANAAKMHEKARAAHERAADAHRRGESDAHAASEDANRMSQIAHEKSQKTGPDRSIGESVRAGDHAQAADRHSFEGSHNQAAAAHDKAAEAHGDAIHYHKYQSTVTPRHAGDVEGHEFHGNQFTSGGAAASAHEKAASAHDHAAKLNRQAARPSMGHDYSGAKAARERDRSAKANEASKAANEHSVDVENKQRPEHESEHAINATDHASDAHSFASHGQHADAARAHERAANFHREAAKALRGGKMKNASAFDRLKSRVMALFDTPEQAASEEAAELIAYRSMRTMLDAVEAQLTEASGLVDALIADEEKNPTDSARQEEAEEEVEDARLDAIRMLCYGASAALSNVCQVTYKLQTPEPIAPSDPRYAEHIKALVGRAISAKNLKVIQSAHDASHDTHAHTVALGAQCNGMKLLEAEAAGEGSTIRAACGCHKETDMNSMERAAALKSLAEIKDANFTADEVKGINMLSDKAVGTLRDLAAKDAKAAIEQARFAADAALAGNGMRMDAKVDDKVTTDEAALKAAKAAGHETVEAHEQAEFYRKNPEIKALVDREAKRVTDRKTELVATLKACGALTEDQLKVKTLEQLEELAAFARVPPAHDFSGRAVPRAASEKDVYANPPDPYAAALEARRKAAVN